MQRMRVFLILLVILFCVPVLIFIVSGKTSYAPLPKVPPISPIPTLQAKLSTAIEELPSLYPDITWNASNTGTVANIAGTSIKPNPEDITKLGQNPDAFFYIISQPISVQKYQQVVAYYHTWFREHAWKEDIIASGPLGDSFGFLKNGSRFLVDFRYLPHDTSSYTVSIEHN